MRWVVLGLGLVAWLLSGLDSLAAAEPDSYQLLGTPLSAADIARVNTDLAPSGLVPPGSGDVQTGRALYASHCQHCHGEDGQGGLHEPLALSAADRRTDAQGLAFALDTRRRRVASNYWPFATTLYDYIRRAMPQLNPGSLSNDQAYALTAYVLYLNGLVDEQARVDGRFLQRLPMPARTQIEFSPEARPWLR